MIRSPRLAVLALALAATVSGCGDEGDVLLSAPAASPPQPANSTPTPTPVEPTGLRIITRFTGKVLEESSGLPVAGARVRACGPVSGETATGSDGRFVLDVGEIVLPFFSSGSPAVVAAYVIAIDIERAGFATRQLEISAADFMAALASGAILQTLGTTAVESLTTPIVVTFAIGDGMNSVFLSVQNAGYTMFAPILMRAGERVHVVVTLDGAPIGPGVNVFAILGENRLVAASGLHNGCSAVVTATTDVNSTAALDGLDPQHYYTLVVPPQDLDEDGRADFLATDANGSYTTALHSILDDGYLRAINVTSVALTSGDVDLVGTSAVAFRAPLVGSSGGNPIGFTCGPLKAGGPYASNLPGRPFAADADENVEFDVALVSSNPGPINVVLDTPTTIVAGSARFRYRNNLVNPDDPAYDESVPGGTAARTSITATAVDLLAGTAGAGQVYQFTPQANLPENEVVALEFSIPLLSSDTRGFTVPFYRPKLGAFKAPTIDNYDGVTNTVTASPSQAYLEFEEVVAGGYQLQSIRVGTVTHTFVGADFTAFEPLVGGYDSMVFNVDVANPSGAAPQSGPASLGATAGVRYRTRLEASGQAFTSNGTGSQFASGMPVSLNNHTPAVPAEVTLVIVARDAEGNSLNQTLTLPVQ